MQYSTLIRKKDKSYQYIITYKINNKWKTKSKQGFPLTREGKELAKSEMDNALDQLKKDTKDEIDPSLIGITFGEFAKMYLKHITLYRETNTVLAYKSAFNHFVSLNKTELNKITRLDIQEVIDSLTRAGLKSSTIKDYIRKVNTLFSSAINEYNLISSMPTKNIKVSENKIESRKRALNKNESDKLLEDFKNGKHSKYYLVILLALTCGLRLGEILGLTWDNIDTKASVLKVTKQWKQLSEKKDTKENSSGKKDADKEYGFGTLKSKNSNREVPIPPKTNNILKSITVKNMNGRVFNFKNTDSVSICINRLLRLGNYNITVHELRHTYATTLISNGIDFKTAAQFLGHTVEQTMKTYSHVNDDMVKRATTIIENIF